MPRTRKKDLSEAQFREQLAKRGYRDAGFMGYVYVTDSTMACRYNGGARRRDQLRYLDQQHARITTPTAPDQRTDA